jgi:hypothetical protein
VISKYELLLGNAVHKYNELIKIHHKAIPADGVQAGKRTGAQRYIGTPSERAPRSGGKTDQRKEAQGMAAKGKAAKSKGITKDAIRDTLRATETDPKSLCKTAKEKFGVDIKPAELASAPNGGVMKMRAGNLIRSSLKAAGRLAV